MGRTGTYKFERCITDPHHFINRYIDYAQERTDASWDYHEAQAIMLLSLATQGILWQIPAVPGGLGTNLYMLNHGRTSDAKKSTVMSIASEVQRRAMPGVDIPENFTPGALEELLEERSNRPAMLWADEFNGHLDKMHHQSYMAGMRGFLLSMYGKRNWKYQRVSKGKSKTKDMVEITNAHLCIAGNTTPAVTDTLKSSDIDDGFLARFAIIWPQDAPKLKGLRDMTYDEDARDTLSGWLRDIRDMVIQISELEDRSIGEYSTLVASDEAYDVLDEYQRDLSKRGPGRCEQTQCMMQRLPVMALKISVLMAVGRPGRLMADHITVTEEDAQWAVGIVRKWERWAELFVASMSRDILSKEINIAAAHLRENGGKASRTAMARRLRLTRFKLDEVQFTMADRGLIYMREIRSKDGARPAMYWITPEYLEREKKAKEEEKEK